MSCTCNSPSATYPAGSTSATAATYTIGAGQQQQIAGSQASRRSVAISNQSTGRIVVGFGQVSVLVDGPGAGYTVEPGATLTVNTTAEVTVLNPTAAAATVGLIVELD